MSNNIERKAEHLAPGSVWESSRGSRFTVLAVTNISVAEDANASRRKQELFPLSVVFLNEENDSFSCNAESFLKAYDFVYNDEVVESYISQVYEANVGELGPVDRKKIEEEQKESSVKASKNKDTDSDDSSATLAQQMLGCKYSVKFICDSEEARPLLTSEALSEVLASYSVNLDSTGSRFYKLVFAVNGVVNPQTINATFNPEVYGDEDNAYQKFVITSDIGLTDDITWNTYCGMSLEIVNQESFIAVTLADVVEQTPVEASLPVAEVDFEDQLSALRNEHSDDHEPVAVEEAQVVEENEHPSIDEEAVAEFTEIENVETVEDVEPVVVASTEQEPLPTEAPITLVDNSVNEHEDDLNLDEDLVTNELPPVVESTASDVVEDIQENKAPEVTADPETPHTIDAQLASIIAKRVTDSKEG